MDKALARKDGNNNVNREEKQNKQAKSRIQFTDAERKKKEIENSTTGGF